jgi:hypothetical protein
MSMVCPKCGASYEQRFQCPVCGDRLLYQQSSRRSRRLLPLPGARWQDTLAGRFVIGVLLAQGLFHGFRQLETGVLLAINSEGGVQQTVTTPEGFVSLQILQIIAVVCGGMLAASGNRYGLLVGMAVGAVNGLICTVLQFGSPQLVSPVVLYGQPLIHIAGGALGGWLGYIIWKPLPAPGPEGSKQVKRRRLSLRENLLAGPVAWVRVSVGVLIAVAGTLSASWLRDMILDVTAGRLNTTEFQDYVITWELKALAILLGGVAAGFNTRNGFKQGLCAGVAIGIILIGVEARGTRHFFEVAGLLCVSSVSLACAGGWFGSHLFPPVVNYKRSIGTGMA